MSKIFHKHFSNLKIFVHNMGAKGIHVISADGQEDVSDRGSGGDENVYTCDVAFELTGHGRYSYLCLLTCSIISNAIGVDMFGFGIIVAAATCDLKLGIMETGVLASAPFAGILFCCVWGYIADTFGRRRTLLISTSISFVLSVLCSFSPNWQIMLALKIIECSFSIGTITMMTYLGESTIDKHRSQYMFIMNSFDLAAEFVAFVLAFLVLPLDFNIPIPWLSITFRPWRLLNLLLATPIGLGSLLMCFLYESPKHLAHNGETDRALKVLNTIHKMNNGNIEYPVKGLVKNKEVRQSFLSTIGNQMVPIFQPPLLKRSLQLFYLMTLCCATNYVFAMWYSKMINSFFTSFSNSTTQYNGFCERVINNIDVNEVNNTTITTVTCDDTISNNTIYAGMVYGLLFTILNLSVTKFAVWRRIVLLVTFGISAVSCILVNVVNQPVVNILAFTLLQGTSIGIGVIFSYFVDLFPTSNRSFATSLGVTISRLIAFAGVNLVGVVIVDHCDVTFYAWAIYVLSGIGVTLLLPSDKELNKSREHT